MTARSACAHASCLSGNPRAAKVLLHLAVGAVHEISTSAAADSGPGSLEQEATPQNLAQHLMGLLCAAPGTAAMPNGFGGAAAGAFPQGARDGASDAALLGVQVPCVTYFDAQLQILDLLEHKAIFTAGYKAILHLHSLVEECEITRLLAQVNIKTKEKKKARLMHRPRLERARALK